MMGAIIVSFFAVAASLSLAACNSSKTKPSSAQSSSSEAQVPRPAAAVTSCEDGFELKDGRCVDVDECAFVANVCGTPLATCANKPGGYECSCPRGYAGGGPLGIACAPRIAAGLHATCALPEKGGAWCWGAELGGAWSDLYPDSIVAEPTKILATDEAVAVVLGHHHACVLNRDTTVGCWGLNADGQLGDDTGTRMLGPRLIQNLRDVRMIAAAGSHTCAVTRFGKTLCWGVNHSGQVGLPPPEPRKTPYTVSVGPAVSVALGMSHSCALRTDGTLWCWGGDRYGAFGTGKTSPDYHPPAQLAGVERAVVQGELSALRDDGQVLIWGENRVNIDPRDEDFAGLEFLTPTPFGTAMTSPAISVSARGGQWCALEKSGTVWCRGVGQLGDGTKRGSDAPVSAKGVRDAVALSLSPRHACALSANGKVFCWGTNWHKQVGPTKKDTVVVPTPVPEVSLFEP